MLPDISFGIILEKCKGNTAMESNQITLRPFRPKDQAQILEILTSPKVNQTYILPDFKAKEDAIPLFRRLVALSMDSTRFVRCIDLDGIAIGFLNDVEIRDGFMELGYVIHPDYHNRGYMTQALKLAISNLFTLGYRQVVCGAFEENKASQRVMEKCCMTPMEQIDTIEYRGKTHICVYYQKRIEETPC